MKRYHEAVEGTASRRGQRDGFVLIVVLVVVAILALSAYTYTTLMQTEQQAAQLTGRRIQTRYLVDSGIESVRSFMNQDSAAIAEAGGTYDNPALFSGAYLFVDPDDPSNIGYFTVIAPALDELGSPAGFRYGLIDESTRLNVNILLLADEVMPNGGRELLMALPSMTEEIADSILDYLDPDDEPRDFGVEGDYYSNLPTPYSAKNGPLDSVEELLQVAGVTPELLFGADTNHNGVIDEFELDLVSGDLEDPAMALGWASFMTLFSKEGNLNSDGDPRIYVNGEDLEQLHTDLRSVFTEEWSDFIIAMRQSGPYTGTSAPDEDDEIPDVDFSIPASYEFSQVLDAIDAMVEMQGEDGAVIVESPLRSDEVITMLPLLMDNLTTVEGPTIPGRININQAPRVVLQGIPGMDTEIVDAILSARSLNPDEEVDENRQFETWLLAEDIVDLNQMRTMLPFVCVKGAVYRANVIGYFDSGEATSRAEVILDTTTGYPRILFWRDKSHLPLGYTLDTLGMGGTLEE